MHDTLRRCDDHHGGPDPRHGRRQPNRQPDPGLAVHAGQRHTEGQRRGEPNGCSDASTGGQTQPEDQLRKLAQRKRRTRLSGEQQGDSERHVGRLGCHVRRCGQRVQSHAKSHRGVLPNWQPGRRLRVELVTDRERCWLPCRGGHGWACGVDPGHRERRGLTCGQRDAWLTVNSGAWGCQLISNDNDPGTAISAVLRPATATAAASVGCASRSRYRSVIVRAVTATTGTAWTTRATGVENAATAATAADDVQAAEDGDAVTTSAANLATVGVTGGARAAATSSAAGT